MPKYLIVLLLLLAVTVTQAQQPALKRFHMEISGGLAIPEGLSQPGLEVGMLLAFEPRYMLSEQFKLGMRFETAVMISNLFGEGATGNTTRSQSGYMLTGDYLFQEKKVQPFAGLGVGVQSVYNEDYNEANPGQEVAYKDVLAVMLRTGMEFADNRFRLAMEYNLVSAVSFSSNNKYLSFKLGAMLFTRKKRKA